MTITTVHVMEVGMALPGVLYVKIRDQDLEMGKIMVLAAQDSAAQDTITWRDWNTGAATGTDIRQCVVTGVWESQQRRIIRFMPQDPTNFLDRTTCDNVANWPVLGGRNPISIHKRVSSFETDHRYTTVFPNTSTLGANPVKKISCYEHDYYVRYDGPIPEGDYTIAVTGNPFPATAFTYNYLTTRCPAILATWPGWRPNDGGKFCRVMLWLSDWEDNGNIDIVSLLGSNTIHIINESNYIVHTGTLVEEYNRDSLIPRMGRGGTSNRYYYARSDVPPQVPQSITAGLPTIFNHTAHGYANGEVLAFRGFSSRLDTGQQLAFEFQTYAITVINANQYSIHTSVDGVVANTTGATWFKGSYVANGGYSPVAIDGCVYKTYLGSMFNTYVYKYDHSDYTFEAENLKYYIPGLGVSDSWDQHDGIWNTVTAQHMKGFYNQLWFKPLDGAIGGLTRPANFTDGYNSKEVYESYQPQIFNLESVTLANFFPGASAAAAPWISTTRVTNWAGPSVHDAGDGDSNHVGDSLPVYYLLEYAYRWVPAASRNSQWGYPKARVLCDPTFYSVGTDALGDVVHMACSVLDCFRRYQKPDGRVYGGYQYNLGAGAYSSFVVPSSYHHLQNIVLLSADPMNNFLYAALAGKIGQVFNEAGFVTEGAAWVASAELAFDWAEALWQDFKTNSVAGPVIQGYFATTLDFYTRAAATTPPWSTTKSNTAIAELFNNFHTGVFRTWAATVLLNATNDPAYETIIQSRVPALWADGLNDYTGHANWEHIQSPQCPTAQRDYVNSRWDTAPSSNGVYGELAMRVRAALKGAQDSSNPHYAVLRRRLAEALGICQTGKSKIIGVGNRWPRNLTHNDKFAFQLTGEQMTGTRIYHNASRNLGGGASIFDGATDHPVWANAELYSGLYEDTLGSRKMRYPLRLMQALDEITVDSKDAINFCEYTITQSITNDLYVAQILNAWDSNTATGFVDPGPFRSTKTLVCTE